MKVFVSIVTLLVLSGCASNGFLHSHKGAEAAAVAAVRQSSPPHIWSGHKELAVSESECAKKGVETLRSLGFIQVVESSHGSYVYGNHGDNRAAIKCVPVAGVTFVYAVVGGPVKATVEKFRNQIMWRL